MDQVIKLFTMVISYHSMAITVVILFYNTGWQQYHGKTVNYNGRKFYNFGPK
jgi:hypothetical protein